MCPLIQCEILVKARRESHQAKSGNAQVGWQAHRYTQYGRWTEVSFIAVQTSVISPPEPSRHRFDTQVHE
jgi:hypothetical protein